MATSSFLLGLGAGAEAGLRCGGHSGLREKAIPTRVRNSGRSGIRDGCRCAAAGGGSAAAETTIRDPGEGESPRQRLVTVQKNPGDGFVLTREQWSWDIREEGHYRSCNTSSTCEISVADVSAEVQLLSNSLDSVSATVQISPLHRHENRPKREDGPWLESPYITRAGEPTAMQVEISTGVQMYAKPSFKCSRRLGVSSALFCATSIFLGHVLNPNPTLAEETTAAKEEGGTFVDGVLELFDPDQVTKTGKKLPKKYVKSVREVVKNLRESFTQDSNDGAKFRRNADSAKEAIREYLQNWRGSRTVEAEESYVALERAFRELGKFYASKGPQAALPEDIRDRVLEDLNKADASL